MAWSKKTFIDPPTINIYMAWILMLVNVFCPGIGTMVVGFCTCSLENFLVGVFQLLLAPIVVGWVWSVWWGCELIQVSKKYTHHIEDVKHHIEDVTAGII